MGELKALLPWQDTSLLEHQVASLKTAGVARTVVVLGHEAGKLEPLLREFTEVQLAYNPEYRQGKTTSIRVGLRSLRGADGGPPQEDAVLILNVDQPRSPETIRRVMELHVRSVGEGDTPLITIPTYLGKGGHPVVLSTTLFPQLLAISEDTQGLKAVVRRHEGETQRVEVDSPEVLLDLNTPQDYRKALEIPASS